MRVSLRWILSRCLRAAFAIACLLFCDALLHAQTTATGSVRGVIKDSNGGLLAGVVITATSPSAPATAMAVTDREGGYHLSNLPPGIYKIETQLQGFTTLRQEGVVVQTGVTTELDLEMEIGAVAETVVIKAEAPLLEVASGVQSVNISGELLRSMPLTERREWFGAFLLTPGAIMTDTATGDKTLYVHGADLGSNVVQIDGADVTPTLGSQPGYIGLNTGAVDDIQIKTAGTDASTPLGVGGVVNIATANGTNQLKGAAGLYLQPLAWNGSNNAGGTSTTVDQRQADLSLGTPLIRDRLWAFGAYRFVDVSTGLSRTPLQLTSLQALVPGFAPFDDTNVAHLGFAKLNARLSDSQQLSGFYQRDTNPVSIAADPATATPHTEITGGLAGSVRLSSVWSDHLISRLGVSGNDKRRAVPPVQVAVPVQRVYQTTVAIGGLIAGSGRLIDRGAPYTGGSTQTDSTITISFDTTWATVGRRSGSHELDTGFYAQPRIEQGLVDFYPNGGAVYEEAVLRQPGNLSGGVIPFHRLIIDRVSNERLKRRGEDYAFYVQDAWHPTSRLTLSPGVRLDRIVWTDQIFNTTAERTTAIGPRFGLNYAITADTRNIARAHWARVHDRPAQTGTSVGTSTPGQTSLYDLDLDGTFETVLVTPPTIGITPNISIDRGLHQPYVQEWGAGYSTQFPGRTTAGIDILRRAFRDRPTLVETNGVYNGDVFVGYANPAFNQLYEVMNNRWNTPVYTSLEVSVTKRTADLQGIASYVRQWHHIDGTWQPNDPASFIQPDAFANAAGIGSTAGSTSTPSDANSLSGTSMFQSAAGSWQWQDHVVRLGVSYTAPRRAGWTRWASGLQLATNYTLQSGAWSGPIVKNISAPDPMFGPTFVTLSNGRKVTNPLATTVRFAYPTRGEGQLVTPAVNIWNVRVGRRVTLHRLTFDADLDVFNVVNAGSDYSFQVGANQTYNLAFGSTTYRQLPRSAQIAVRASF